MSDPNLLYSHYRMTLASEMSELEMDPTWQVVMDRIMGRLKCLQRSKGRDACRPRRNEGQRRTHESHESAGQEEIKAMVNLIWSV
jgi:hypothetical protein